MNANVDQKNYMRVLERMEAYAGAYSGLRTAVQLFLDGDVGSDFLAASAEKMDQALQRQRDASS